MCLECTFVVTSFFASASNSFIEAASSSDSSSLSNKLKSRAMHKAKCWSQVVRGGEHTKTATAVLTLISLSDYVHWSTS